MILSGNTFYGTTQFGGSANHGVVFGINADGTSLTNLHNFSSAINSTNSDGYYPFGGLLLSGDTLYGTTLFGGQSGSGAIFRVKTNGSAFTNLHSFSSQAFPNFTNSDGAFPHSSLVLLTNSLYGTTVGGGISSNGTIFKINTDGTGFTNLHNFSATAGKLLTNADGALPDGGVILSGNNLFGTTSTGGAFGDGTIYRLNVDGTAFTNLHNFTGDDGADSQSALIISGNTLYGITTGGGVATTNGTVFKLNTDGTGFQSLHSFAASASDTNSDGITPFGTMVLSNYTLYGTTELGGNFENGTVYSVNTDGTGFTVLHQFAPYGHSSTTNSDGSHPKGGLLLSSNTLYGTAFLGGLFDQGTLFSLFLQPQLTINVSDTNVILTWPASYTQFTLQTATDATGTATWTTVLPPPAIVGDQNTVTNTPSGNATFYRLIQNQ